MLSRGEVYTLVLYKRKKNTSYEYEDVPKLTFKGRIAKPIERNFYDIQSGVTGNSDEVYIFSSNLPNEVEVGDRVYHLGKFWTVSSVGVYLEQTRCVNASVFDPKKLIEMSPKGITLK